jgi:hypothetical protein
MRANALVRQAPSNRARRLAETASEPLIAFCLDLDYV